MKNKKHWFKKELKTYNDDQMNTLLGATAMFIELMKKTTFISTSQYAMNRNYLFNIRKDFKGISSIQWLISELLDKMDIDYETYLDNLKSIYPECYNITDGDPEEAFCVRCAESKYLAAIWHEDEEIRDNDHGGNHEK